MPALTDIKRSSEVVKNLKQQYEDYVSNEQKEVDQRIKYFCHLISL